MKKLLILASLLALALATGCATTPKPPPEEFYVALANSTAKWGVYAASRNNLDDAMMVKGWLKGINVDSILTYQAWVDLVAQAPIKAIYKGAITDAIVLCAVYMPQPEDSLTPLAKKIIKAVIAGGLTGLDMAISEMT